MGEFANSCLSPKKLEKGTPGLAHAGNSSSKKLVNRSGAFQRRGSGWRGGAFDTVNDGGAYPLPGLHFNPGKCCHPTVQLTLDRFVYLHFSGMPNALQRDKVLFGSNGISVQGRIVEC
jgi:hypothetical protein